MIIVDLIIEGYEEPNLEGDSITFSCHDELMFTGPNSSTCVENGEWEPNPREAFCTSVITSIGLMTTGASILRNIIIPQMQCLSLN